MIPTDFKQSNKTYVAPSSMPDCKPLQVLESDGMILSRWKMSWRERLSALVFGIAWVKIATARQPPIAIDVTKDVF